MSTRRSDDEGPFWVFAAVVVAMVLIGFASGLYAGRAHGRDQGCQDLCDTQYAWWGKGVCICAEGKKQ